jgi:hypothetical protein
LYSLSDFSVLFRPFLHVISFPVLNKPTKKLTKDGVLCKRQTSSLARFDHSCVLNALLEIVNGAF